MRKYLGIAVLAILLIAVGTAYADPIPGSINELQNGDFELGAWGAWQAGSDMGIALDGPNHWAAYCKQAGSPNLWLRQVVDDKYLPDGTLNPNWNDLFHQKEVDLMADISLTWFPGGQPQLDQNGNTISRIRFGLDWWDETFNDVNDPRQLPKPQYLVLSDWYYFNDAGNGQWRVVNPWDDDIWVFGANDKTMQPRWISVEVIIEQASGEEVWVDNMVLTSKCIPEPMSMILGGLGLSSVVGLRRLRRK